MTSFQQASQITKVSQRERIVCHNSLTTRQVNARNITYRPRRSHIKRVLHAALWFPQVAIQSDSCALINHAAVIDLNKNY